MTCPCCGTPLVMVREEYLDGVWRAALLERERRCPLGCYEEQYAYGHYRDLYAPWWRRWANALVARAGRLCRRLARRRED